MKHTDKDALLRWDDFRSNLLQSTPVPVETEKERRERIWALEKNPEAWFAFYLSLIHI